ncbi:Na(+)/H(+) antiporter subunit D [Desulfonatronovibrio hydrogenovorans]|uniref:Na(+)/H(+) antiporter subunit D n=1 Tax=Desulfonatronovibrio hydrogenovorans TaxID=53245 RepID=UPI00048F5473|nr:Na(+)/H(+) antiporter subunit D [Desulfonatronovibrio hydrogenovorans]
MFELPPVLVMWLGLIILPFLPRDIRPKAFILFPFLALAIILTTPVGTEKTLNIFGYEFIIFKITQLSRVFGIIFALIAFLGGIYSMHMKETGQQAAALIYAGGALGVTFCGDFFTLFVFWELMAIGSTYLIWARRTVASDKAGMRYLLMHLFGGSLLLAGIIMQIHSSGSILLTDFAPGESMAAWFILAGVGLNAAVFPLHAWLPDSYPKATVTGSVFLSAFTTKTAVYVLASLFPGWPILLVLGVTMTLYGVTFAFLANDIREILAYHIMSQVGYMVAGVGIGTELAINGTTAHAFSHILYKALLFMGTGAVLYSVGTTKLHELGALASRMKWVLIFYMVAALSISGAPLFNGFISKAIIVEAAGQSHLYLAKMLLILASVGTFLSVGIKLPYYTWFHTPKKEHTVKPVPKGMMVAMAVTSFLCIFYGIFPKALYVELPYVMDYNPFTIPHLVEVIQILIMTFLAFWMVRAKLTPKNKISLDVDWFYRKAAPGARLVFVGGINRIYEVCEVKAFDLAHNVSRLARHPVQVLRTFKYPSRDYDENLDRQPLSSSMFLTILVTVLVFILVIW